MKIFGSLYEKVLAWSRHSHAPRYLAGVSFFESFIFPVPVAIMLLPMTLAEPKKAYRLARLTLIFSVLGGIAGYLLGMVAYELLISLLQGHAAQFEKAQNWFAEYGVWVVLIAGFSPVPYKIFTITAGTLLMPFVPFLIASVVGRASQFYLIAFLANKFGPAMEPKIRQYVEWLGWGTVLLAGVAIAWLNLR
jgi:membrane protein YqaA with SNARE-associated domain